ncbi:thiamine pyrophosphokinase-related protein [Aspergillus alliaceus]|uniref:thiamine pyrophosphokinase-related protein n=1 Tax=Petromyces alliaceus TaxID=209559 RepID=UPI0012A53FB3|nr:putative NUDIX family hydrolase [Aspergillus alliaceus]KAB8237523.1 putative NUDIX family hydrolase [Aspergillus alliaceus]
MRAKLITQSSFPYREDNPGIYYATLKNYHTFKIQGIDGVLGYIPTTLVQSISWPEEYWTVDTAQRELRMTPRSNTLSSRNNIIEDAIRRIAEQGSPEILKGWRNERFPVYGPDGTVVVEIERSASAQFGIVTSGVQMLCFVEDEGGSIHLWIGKRSEKKQTYPGMLDCTAAGALSVGESPRSAMVLEATDEASLDTEMIEKHMRSVGHISYFHVKSSTSTGNKTLSTALLLPETEYLYELKLDQHTVPRPKDSEVEDFRLWSVDQVLDALKNGMFKPNSAVVVIDFFIRHGIITPETEAKYLEIIQRLHRRLPFPVAHRIPKNVD